MAKALAQKLEEFICLHQGMQQRGAEWHRRMGVTVGGSELAAVMGLNPYSDFNSVVASKIATISGINKWEGGEACWWGTLFEDVIGKYVETDFGSPVRGDSICVQVVEGHRNSPDGYIIVNAATDDHSRRVLVPDGEPHVALLEFKCPLTRMPTGNVPGHYLPQVLSGLAVSPLASFGIFVDAVFRKCSQEDWRKDTGYDTKYHRRDNGCFADKKPVARGMIAVYIQEASGVSNAGGAINAKNIVDLGRSTPQVFQDFLSRLDKKIFTVGISPIMFADGRGEQDYSKIVDFANSAKPEGHRVWGLLPWKLFKVNYSIVEREPGFLERVAPLIKEVHDTVAAWQRSGSTPEEFLRKLEIERRNAPASSASSDPLSAEANEDVLYGATPKK